MQTTSRICSRQHNMLLSSRYVSWRKDITSWLRRATERSTWFRRLRPSICPSWRRLRSITMLTRTPMAQEVEILQPLVRKWEASVKKHKKNLLRIIRTTMQTPSSVRIIRRTTSNWKPYKIWWLKWKTHKTSDLIQASPTTPTASSPSGYQWSNS
jgi:hypothetical protein